MLHEARSGVPSGGDPPGRLGAGEPSGPLNRRQPSGRRPARRATRAVAGTAVVLVIVGLMALAMGRYNVPFWDVVQTLASRLVHVPAPVSGAEQNVVLLVRLPRVLLALLVGGGLAIGGAALQAIFRNPLVSPDIIGVSAGASFGGALALLLGVGSIAHTVLSFHLKRKT